MNSIKDFDLLPNSALVRLPTVKEFFPWSHTTIRRRAKNGTIAAPTRLLGSTSNECLQ